MTVGELQKILDGQDPELQVNIIFHERTYHGVEPLGIVWLQEENEFMQGPITDENVEDVLGLVPEEMTCELRHSTREMLERRVLLGLAAGPSNPRVGDYF